jgi:hypothetical protein
MPYMNKQDPKESLAEPGHQWEERVLIMSYYLTTALDSGEIEQTRLFPNMCRT